MPVISREPREPPTLAEAKALALRWLAARPRTELQMRDKLARRGCASEVADAVVSWLFHLRYLDDAAYAQLRARNLTAPGRLGPRLAQRRLEATGISKEMARAAVEAAISAGAGADDAAGAGPTDREAAERALARAALERRTRGVPPTDDKARARLARFLLGRGFSGEVVSSVLGVYVDG